MWKASPWILTSNCRYQDLALKARDIWLSWNQTIRESSPDDLPEGLSPDDKLLYLCGSYFLAEGPNLREFYDQSLRTMQETASGQRKMQFVKVMQTLHDC